jgi:prepilin-type N-terminal cleavage/methylation domain-containing protein
MKNGKRKVKSQEQRIVHPNSSFFTLHLPRGFPMKNIIRRREIRAGFTLIELLVVVGIIVILVGILLPVVSTMHKKAQQTDSFAEITRIAESIHHYFEDYHSYPGPIPESQIYGNNGTLGQTSVLTNASSVSSSENLVLGLLGGIQAPTPTTPGPPLQYVVSNLTPPTGPQSLNLMNPKQAISYYDATAAEISNDGAGNPVSWSTVPSSAGGGKDALAPSGMTIPELMDHFGNPHPILYLRAVVGGNTICDNARSASTPGSQYFTAELNPYWRVFSNTTLIANGVLPTPAPTSSVSGGFSTPDASNNQFYQSAYYFFQNPTLQDGVTPRSKDSFILISAGSDGIYGTADDIVYPPN